MTLKKIKILSNKPLMGKAYGNYLGSFLPQARDSQSLLLHF